METCIHQNKRNCGFCVSIFQKPIQWHINDWYLSQTVGQRGVLEAYWSLKAWLEKQGSYEATI